MSLSLRLKSSAANGSRSRASSSRHSSVSISLYSRFDSTLTPLSAVGILAGKFYSLSTVSFIVCFALLQFFFNFGANATTYAYPAEVFPTKFRATAHGVSAAAGKAGAIISALAFNELSESVGTPVVLWSASASFSFSSDFECGNLMGFGD